MSEGYYYMGLILKNREKWAYIIERSLYNIYIYIHFHIQHAIMCTSAYPYEDISWLTVPPKTFMIDIYLNCHMVCTVPTTKFFPLDIHK